MASFSVEFISDGAFPIAFESSEAMIADFGSTVRIGDFDTYEGEYEFIPSDQEQIIPTEALLMRQNITIHAVPNTYGHIGWNGATLTVY